MAYRIEELPLDKIAVKKENVRVHDIDAGIDDLAASIKAHGLLEPIVAYKSADKYFILAGQRRLNAYVSLNNMYPGSGFDCIPCLVRDEPESDNQKKALSLAENITQLPMNDSDLIKAVTDLYNVYGDYDLVQEKFGLSRYMVNKYVKFSRLPPELKAAINNGEISRHQKQAVNMAIKAVDAYDYTPGSVTPINDVLELAKALAAGTVDPQDAKKGAGMGKTIDEMEKMKVEKVPIKIDLARDIDEKLEKVARSNASSKALTAALYIIKGVERDYDQVEQQHESTHG